MNTPRYYDARDPECPYDDYDAMHDAYEDALSWQEDEARERED